MSSSIATEIKFNLLHNRISSSKAGQTFFYFFIHVHKSKFLSTFYQTLKSFSFLFLHQIEEKKCITYVVGSFLELAYSFCIYFRLKMHSWLQFYTYNSFIITCHFSYPLISEHKVLHVDFLNKFPFFCYFPQIKWQVKTYKHFMRKIIRKQEKNHFFVCA